jgi:hypothetical protein
VAHHGVFRGALGGPGRPVYVCHNNPITDKKEPDDGCVNGRIRLGILVDNPSGGQSARLGCGRRFDDLVLVEHTVNALAAFAAEAKLSLLCVQLESVRLDGKAAKVAMVSRIAHGRASRT